MLSCDQCDSEACNILVLRDFRQIMSAFTHPFLRTEQVEVVSRKDEVLLSSVLQWFNEEESRVRTFSDIVNHRNGLSLRIIDWLITNFSKAFSVAIESDGLPRNLCKDYHKNLTAHNKKNFDPFARRRRINIVLFGGEHRVSTIGQLNFFRWFLSKDLVEFLIQNKTVIEKHMKDSESKSTRIVKRKMVVEEDQTPPPPPVPKTLACKPRDKTKFRAASASASASASTFASGPQLYSGTFRMSF